MVDNLYPSLILPNSCKHISYIKTKAMGQLLQLSHFDVIDNERNQCYVPGCHNSDPSQLKTFVLMGYPPKKTYYPINYIGLGLYPPDSLVTEDWYTAYVPLNKYCFKNDPYNIKKCLLKLIENSRLWISRNDYKAQSNDGNLENLETTDSFQELDFSSENFTQDDVELRNVFRFPLESKNVPEFQDYIFATPSCMYATRHELATPLEFKELEVRLQMLIQVKIKPDSFVKSQNSISLSESFDSCFPNSEIEWYSNSPNLVVADRILFKILPKKDETSPKESQEPKTEKVTSVTLLAPNLNLGRNLSSDAGFLEIKDLYKFEKSEDFVVLDGNKDLLLKLKYTENHNKVLYYLKTLMAKKKLGWDPESKLWKVPGQMLYELVKFCTYISLKVDNKVLYELWIWLMGAGIKNLPSIFDSNAFTRWLRDYPVFSFQRVVLDFSGDSMMVDVVPYNKDLVSMFKDRNSSNYSWDKDKMMWRFSDLKQLVSDVLGTLPNLKEASDAEREFMESKGIFMAASKTQVSQSKRTKQPETFKMQKRRRLTETEDESEFITKLIITVAGREEHLDRLARKVNNVIEKVAPPRSSISTSGKVVMGGAGTGGIEFVQVPKDFEAWNMVSMCIVPDEENNMIPIDKYDKNLLASLIGDVFIVKEAAIDYLLTNFKTWPGPHDNVNYTKWSFCINQNEPRCWGGVDFDGRQSLAQAGLFDNEDFYISGNNMEAEYTRMLILLGCGKIVNDPKEAEYVIVTDPESSEAKELYKKFGDNDEDLISVTHGARHSTLVTPKYIYDCILEWKLKRPTQADGHMAFPSELAG